MDMNHENVVSAPKTGSFQMRINPQVKMKVEEVYAAQGLTLTDAVNIFIQQSLNANGLPFLVSAENEAYLRAKAVSRLLDEVEKGWQSARDEGWVSEEDAHHVLSAGE
jgi:DNA-damage-inducible protein J